MIWKPYKIIYLFLTFSQLYSTSYYIFAIIAIVFLSKKYIIKISNIPIHFNNSPNNKSFLSLQNRKSSATRIYYCGSSYSPQTDCTSTVTGFQNFLVITIDHFPGLTVDNGPLLWTNPKTENGQFWSCRPGCGILGQRLASVYLGFCTILSTSGLKLLFAGGTSALLKTEGRANNQKNVKWCSPRKPQPVLYSSAIRFSLLSLSTW